MGAVAARRVTALDGTTWTVRRRWTPRYEGRGLRARWTEHRRRRGRPDNDGGEGRTRWYDWLDPFGFADSLTGLAIAIALVVVVVLLFVWGVPLLLALVDLVLVLLVVAGGTVGRLLLRRPWHIEAVAADGRRVDRHAVGWRGSREVRDELAAEIAHGRGAVGSPP